MFLQYFSNHEQNEDLSCCVGKPNGIHYNVII